MKLTEQEQKKLVALAKSNKGTFLIEYLEKVKDYAADIRNPMTIEPSIQIQVRQAVCEVIEDILIGPLKRFAEDRERDEDSYI